jgi:hypothetical protein
MIEEEKKKIPGTGNKAFSKFLNLWVTTLPRKGVTMLNVKKNLGRNDDNAKILISRL